MMMMKKVYSHIPPTIYKKTHSISFYAHVKNGQKEREILVRINVTLVESLMKINGPLEKCSFE